MREAELGDARNASQDSMSGGTRFLLFPQAPHVSGYERPETVWLSTPPGQIRAGPEDSRMYVRDPILEKQPYEFPYLPPFVGDVVAPAEPDYEGHFDQIPVGSRQFLAAHAFASVSRVLDIWESYVGKPVAWHFADTYERLEIIPLVDWENAQSGYGFLELGREFEDSARGHPYALNFDVIAHEVGHAIQFSLYGMPWNGLAAGDFAAFHEASSDLISLMSFLHFDSGMDRLLRHSQANLLVLNELNRIAELTGDRQLRLASNARKMSEVSAEVHDRSRPFTGAVFDTLVEVYHAGLVQQDLADARLLGVDLKDIDASAIDRISAYTARAYRARPFLFKSELVRARDEVCLALARAWVLLDSNDLTFANAAETILDTADRVSPALAKSFEGNFVWREIL
ncbi:hypothetical protein [Mesorhizobium helmanticense]|nr:hypothetical protein [Mesorhizobium helmanticense]